MDGLYTQELESFGSEPKALWGSFSPNGTSNPLTASNLGPPGLKTFTTVYAATGQYTVTLPADVTVVGIPNVQVTAQAADLAGYFEVMVVGDYNPATRSFVIQAKRANAGQAVAAAAGARIHWALHFNNSTGL